MHECERSSEGERREMAGARRYKAVRLCEGTPAMLCRSVALCFSFVFASDRRCCRCRADRGQTDIAMEFPDNMCYNIRGYTTRRVCRDGGAFKGREGHRNPTSIPFNPQEPLNMRNVLLAIHRLLD